MVHIGLDYGKKKTGFAVYREGIILPSGAVFGSWGKILKKLNELSVMYGEVFIVIGLPLSATWKPTELSVEVKKFAEWLAEFGYDVELVNEVGSSAAASKLLGKKDRKGRVDSIAACEILKRYLNLI